MKYKGEFSPLFKELETIIKPYYFLHTNKGKVQDSDYGEKELEIILNDKFINNSVYSILNKYKLTPEDFICIIKTSINYNFYSLQYISCKGDEFGLDFSNIIKNNKLNVPRDFIKKYREEYNTSKENTQLVLDIKENQKEYLKLMKKLLSKNPSLVNELVLKELEELGYMQKKDVKRLFKNKKTK